MNFAFHTQMEEYYQRFVDLQEKLRKSEEERMKLEVKFNDMQQIAREEEQAHYKKLRAQYKRFLEEDRKRHDRNEKIIRNLERIETKIAMLSAKTERLNILRRQYQNYLWRIMNSSTKFTYTPTMQKSIKTLPQNQSDYTPFKVKSCGANKNFTVASDFNLNKPIAEHVSFKSSFNSDQSKAEKLEFLEKYLENVHFQQDNLGKKNKIIFKQDINSSSESLDFNSSHKATAIADDIMNSIYSRYYNKSELLPTSLMQRINQDKHIKQDNDKETISNNEKDEELLNEKQIPEQLKQNLTKNTDQEEEVTANEYEKEDILTDNNESSADTVQENKTIKKCVIKSETEESVRKEDTSDIHFQNKNILSDSARTQVENLTEKFFGGKFVSNKANEVAENLNETNVNILTGLAVKEKNITDQQNASFIGEESSLFSETQDNNETSTNIDINKDQIEIDQESPNTDINKDQIEIDQELDNNQSNEQLLTENDKYNESVTNSEQNKNEANFEVQPDQQVYYDENGQPYIQSEQAYDIQNPAYSENNQPIQYDYSQYDQYGQPLLYDQHGQVVQPEYDEQDQIIPQYDETGQLVVLYNHQGEQMYPYPSEEQYDPSQIQYVDNQDILQPEYEPNDQVNTQQYDGESVYAAADQNDDLSNYDQQYTTENQTVCLESQGDQETDPNFIVSEENNKDLNNKNTVRRIPPNEIGEKSNNEDNGKLLTHENDLPIDTISIKESSNYLDISEVAVNQEDSSSLNKVPDILDTDTESSIKQIISKVSNDSDFDFS